MQCRGMGEQVECWRSWPAGPFAMRERSRRAVLGFRGGELSCHRWMLLGVWLCLSRPGLPLAEEKASPAWTWKWWRLVWRARPLEGEAVSARPQEAGAVAMARQVGEEGTR